MSNASGVVGSHGRRTPLRNFLPKHEGGEGWNLPTEHYWVSVSNAAINGRVNEAFCAVLSAAFDEYSDRWFEYCRAENPSPVMAERLMRAREVALNLIRTALA